jgi:hypothetical protein
MIDVWRAAQADMRTARERCIAKLHAVLGQTLSTDVLDAIRQCQLETMNVTLRHVHGAVTSPPAAGTYHESPDEVTVVERRKR